MMMMMMTLINIICAFLEKVIANYMFVTKIIIRITEEMFMMINFMLTNKSP